jgi:hypothetical protein
MLATERWRPEPPHPDERIPVLDDDDDEAEVRAALRAVSPAGTSG